MKKIVSLVLACMLLMSCFAINAFAAVTTFDITASTPDEDGYFTVTFTSPVTLKSAKLIMFLADGVDVVNPDGSAVDFASSYAFEVTTTDGMVMNNEGKGMKYVDHTNGRYILVDVGGESSSSTATGDIFTIYMKKTADITANPFSLVGNDTLSSAYGGINCGGTSVSIKYRASAGTAAANFDWENLKTPVVEEDKFINDEGATGGVATLTFYGRVGADWLDQDYGVIVEGKDFYGAKNGDIISDGAEGTKTFDFDAWDGNFEIILTNITVKGTAGEKTYQFFVGENLTEEATVVVE